MTFPGNSLGPVGNPHWFEIGSSMEAMLNAAQDLQNERGGEFHSLITQAAASALRDAHQNDEGAEDQVVPDATGNI